MEDPSAANGVAMAKHGNDTKKKVHGTVVLMKKNVMDMNNPKASVVDRLYELFLHRRISLQLISATKIDPAKGNNKGMLGNEACLEKWVGTGTPFIQDEMKFSVTFEWDEETMGVPGAFIVKNNHRNEFYLKTLSLDFGSGPDSVHFVCNSWVYPWYKYKKDYQRVFFSNKTYLPSKTPNALKEYREEELVNLRGDGSKEELKKWDRVYDYAYYNDLGMPEKGPEYARPVLGGSLKYPYPRRGKTGRKPNNKDPNTESRLYLLDLRIYVPRDERFNTVKFWDFLAYAMKFLSRNFTGLGQSLYDHRLEFKSFQDVHDLFDGNFELPSNDSLKRIRDFFPWEFVKELLRNDGEHFMKFPKPSVIQDNKEAWMSDEEFARETLAGVNPVVIKRLEKFPPTSKLVTKTYGNQNSTIRKEDLEKNMNGLTVGDAIKDKKLFILDHHDMLMPYLMKINSTNSKIYATRTIFLLQDDGTLKPLAIELSLPHPQGIEFGASSEVFTPAEDGVSGWIWRLAKAYVSVNDSGYHQLISHWLNTHAVMEPFIIASNRQLSVMHPIYKLLQPHFRDTMNINALARHTLISAGGMFEMTVFPGKYALEMSSAVYKNWVFNDQALPVDLVKRGVAVCKSEDIPNPDVDDIELLIKDYPFAVDGLEIWSAIKTWVRDYCNFYYQTDRDVKEDGEIQSWWKEIRNEGHGDLKDEKWWVEMNTKANLIQTCTIIIWVASALHAAVNFGQYPYAGFLPNRPTISRRFMPEYGTKEYQELEKDPELVFLRTITSQIQTLIGVSLIETLSRHSADELYLGQRDTDKWTADAKPIEKLEEFRKTLEVIEKRISERNDKDELKNRAGPVKMPYTLLYPNSSDYTKEGGLTGKGIPNSVSI